MRSIAYLSIIEIGDNPVHGMAPKKHCAVSHSPARLRLKPLGLKLGVRDIRFGEHTTCGLLLLGIIGDRLYPGLYTRYPTLHFTLSHPPVRLGLRALV